jgi:hypothetical protein
MNEQNFDPETLIGLSEPEAKKIIIAAGMKARVRSRNGHGFMGTCEIDMKRVNLIIEDDAVSKASIG